MASAETISLPDGGVLLYESPSPTKIRVLTWFLGFFMLGMFWAATGTFRFMTQAEGSSELAPLSWRIGFAAGIVLAGVGFFGGVVFYLRFYATRLVALADGRTFHVETLRLFGRHTRTLDVGAVVSTTFFRGKFSSDLRPTVEVDAPWYWVAVHGGRGFLLDAQGTFHDSDALGRVLSAGRGIGPSA